MQCSNAIFLFGILFRGLALPTQHMVLNSHRLRSVTLAHRNASQVSAWQAKPLSLAHLVPAPWSCDQHIKQHPDEITCPASCPYLRAEPTRLCQFKCVAASDCNADNPLASYANPSSMRCEACRVPGCYHCGEKRDVCAACQDGFELQDGLCLSVTRHLWTTFFVLLGIVGIFLTYYLFALFFLRSSRNEQALAAGESFREHSIVRKTNDRGELDKVYLWKNLMDAKNNVCGAGVMLHFRWMGAIIVWAIFSTALFAIAGFLYWDRLGVHRPNSRKSYDACEDNVRLQVQEFNNIELVYIICTLICYLVTFLGSLWLAASQHQAYQASGLNNVTMKDFALFATGFPICGGSEKVEEEYLNFLKQQPQFHGLDVIGVSACWNFADRNQEVSELVRREFDFHEGTLDVDYASQSVSSKAQGRKMRACVDPKLRCVDALFGIGDCPCLRSPKEANIDDIWDEAATVKTLLKDLQTCGSLFVIMKSSADTEEACRRCKDNPLVYCRDGSEHNIIVSSMEAEPLTVLWKGFGTDHLTFMMSLVLGCIIVFVCVLFLDLCFYTPYVYYILSYSEVAGMTQGGFLSGLLLGMLITVCNQCIYFIIASVADRCGWTNSDSKDTFYCVKYTLAVFFNTCIDLGTVLILAQGYSVDMAMQMKIANDSTMSSKAIAEGPNIQKALYVQLVAYIFPSCTLLPFLIEPFATTVMPYYIGRALVRTRQEVSMQDAEECLQNPPYDLSRYGDILVNMLLCCMTLVFTYHDLWMLFSYMIISMVIIYMWDHLRVLRFTTKTVYSNASMDNAAMYMMAMPAAVIAACLVFKAYGASHHGVLDLFRHGEGGIIAMTRHTVLPYCVAAFLLHTVIHWILLKFVVMPITDKNIKKAKSVSGRHLTEGQYAEIGRQLPANYFNTNPVNCLRSRYIYKHEPPCIFYRVGKEHLLRKNEKIGLPFEARDHQSARSERHLKSMALGFASGV